VSIIEGDGIGPEISQAVKDIFAAAKVGCSLLLFSELLVITPRPPC
jgi:isocitrate/isopropylmalate dehydrogenase